MQIKKPKMLTCAFVTILLSTFRGRITDVQASGGMNVHGILWIPKWPGFVSPVDQWTDLWEGMTSIKQHKQVEGTSMEKWVKARVHEARPLQAVISWGAYVAWPAHVTHSVEMMTRGAPPPPCIFRATVHLALRAKAPTGFKRWKKWECSD
jgi:hypothetical protein